MKELAEISVQGLTLAMQASTLKELIRQLHIPAEKFEEAAKNPPTPEEQKEAALKLSSEMNQVSEIAQEEAKVNSTEIEPISFLRQSNKELSPETETKQNSNTESELPTLCTNKNDDDPSNPGEENQENRVILLTTESQIQQFVIPVIVDRLNTYGRPDQERQSILYKGEEYTASLKLEKDSQTLSLDRNSPKLEESQEALLASRSNNSEEYSITINNLTKDEFERFKALFKEQQLRREQSKLQVQSQESSNELD
jgi:hypothetical protein